MNKCNQMIFDTSNFENIELAQKFIGNLLLHNTSSRDDYADIHIYQEESLIIVEWTQVFYGEHHFPQGKFILLDSEHVVAKERIMPDNSILYIFDEDAEAQQVKEWYAANPVWSKEDAN